MKTLALLAALGAALGCAFSFPVAAFLATAIDEKPDGIDPWIVRMIRADGAMAAMEMANLLKKIG